MGFRNGSYATVWQVTTGGQNFNKVRISITYKNKEGVYVQTFSGFCSFFGNARAKSEKLKERDRIILKDVDVTTNYVAEKGLSYVNYNVYDFDIAQPFSGKSTEGYAVSPGEGNDQEGDDMPF